MRLGIDFDNTLADFVSLIQRLTRERTGFELRGLIERHPEADDLERVIHAAIGRERWEALLAEIHEECPRTWSARHAYLHDIFLDAAARGSGAGTLLLEALKSWARQRDIWQVRATTGIWNEPSRAFFLKRAFRPACVELLCQLDE